MAEDKGSAVKIISGPGKIAQNLKAQGNFDHHNNQDDILAGPVPQPPAQLGVFPDQVLVRQTTDPLGDDPLALPRPQPLQSPGGSLASLLGSPAAPQQAMDLDDLSNHEEGDGTIEHPKGPAPNDLLNNDFGGNGPADMLAQNINTDINDLFNPRVADQIPMDQDAKKAAPPQESALADEVEFRQNSFVNKEDVLMSNADILKDMGDIEKRNEEFALLMDQTAVE